jgi:quercetin dioxygenase-like cupin family protein
VDNLRYKWHEIEPDNPVPLLHRQMIKGDKMLAAMIRLEAGCKVALHHHESEQIAYVISGHVRWGVGDPGTPERREFEMGGGEVLRLPSNLPHQIEALAESTILDMLAPPGQMGVDQQARKG